MSNELVQNDSQPKAIEETFVELREELKRLAMARIDRRLLGRVDASDIVQETYLTAYRRYDEYLANPEVPLEDWIRFLTVQSVQASHRKHLASQKRTVAKERDMVMKQGGDPSLADLTLNLVDSMTGPQSAAMRSEMFQAVLSLIATMSDVDQEILRLRHQEQMSNVECAEQMGISVRAASKRYVCALRRLREVASEYE